MVWDKVNRTIIHALTGAPAHIKPADGSLIWYALLSDGESIELRVYHNVAGKFFSSQYGADDNIFLLQHVGNPHILKKTTMDINFTQGPTLITIDAQDNPNSGSDALETEVEPPDPNDIIDWIINKNPEKKLK